MPSSRIAREFRVPTDEVEIFRRGDKIVLREKLRPLARGFGLLCGLPAFAHHGALQEHKAG
jgi:antitoxin VapB